MKKIFLIITGLMVVTTLTLAQMVTFTTGETLTAAKLNSMVKVVKDGTGAILGELIGITQSEIYVMKNTGYRFGIDASGSVKSPMTSVNTGAQASCTPTPVDLCYYTDSNCSIAAPVNTAFIVDIMPGMVMYVSTAPAGLYYLDKGTTTVPIFLYQYRTSPTPACYLTGKGYYPTTNNSAITGVSAATYSLPITITNQ